MVHIGICDDQEVHIERLKSYVQFFFEREKIQCEIKATQNSEDLIKDAEKFDIVFMDIQMGDKNGIDVSKILRERNKKFKLIYVTLYNKHMTDALPTYFFGYLNKPIKQEQVHNLLHDALEFLREEQQKIEFNSGRTSYYLNISDIFYIKSDNHSVNVYTDDNIGFYKFNYSMSDIQKKLNFANFTLISRSYLVNISNVIMKNKTAVHMKNGDILPLSKDHREEFNIKYETYIESGR